MTATTPAPSIALLGDVGVDPLQLGRIAREAESAGFAGAWIIEYDYDSQALNQHLLSQTESLTVGSAVMRSMARTPLHVAHNAAILDRITPGRYVIGVGTGPRPRSLKTQDTAAETPVRPVARMREYLQALRMALTEGRIDFEGEFFAFDPAKMGIRPVGHVPIYIAAGGPQMARLAGSLADGVFAYLYDEDGIKRMSETVRDAAVAAGRDPGAVSIGSLVPVCVDDDGDRARLALKVFLLDYYFHLPHYHKVFAEAGYTESAERLQAAEVQGNTHRSLSELLADPAVRDAADALPDDWLEMRTVGGTPQECQRKLAAMTAWGIDVPVCYPFPAGDDWGAGYRAAIAALCPAGAAAGSTDRLAVSTVSAPPPAGPYSQAVSTGELVHLAGQVPRRPDGTRIGDAPFPEQARQTLENLQAVAAAAGGTLADAIKVNVYLKDLADRPAFDLVYAEFVGTPPAARTTVQSALDDVALEVDAVLHVASGSPGHRRR